MSDEIEFNVWIGCLACYNAGRLVGEWYPAIDAEDVTTDAIHGKPTTHEELWVFDIEAPHESLAHEMSPMEATRLATVIEGVRDRLGNCPWQAFVAYAANHGAPLDEDTADDAEDAYAGHYDSFRDYSDDLADELLACERPLLMGPGQRPEELLMYRYFDYEAFARDLRFETTALDAPGHTVYIFRD